MAQSLSATGCKDSGKRVNRGIKTKKKKKESKLYNKGMLYWQDQKVHSNTL